MEIRDQIKELLSEPLKPKKVEKVLGFQRIPLLYQDLKDSLILLDPYTNINRIDDWFKGIIGSLYYMPNRKVLILEQKENNIFPSLLKSLVFFDKNLVFDSYPPISEDDIYLNLIMYVEFDKRNLDISERDNFKLYQENILKSIKPSCDKRLASYCTTTEKWVYPQRKNHIVLQLKEINWELFNSIDKLELWKEIFRMFKP